MGGSAIGAELVAAAAGDRGCGSPFTVASRLRLPPGVGERTLVIAASHSGETVETGFRRRRRPGSATCRWS